VVVQQELANDDDMPGNGDLVVEDVYVAAGVDGDMRDEVCGGTE